MTHPKLIVLAACLTLLAACSGAQDPADEPPAEADAVDEAEVVEAEGETEDEAGADEDAALAEEDAELRDDQPAASPNADRLAGEGSEEGDALCMRNCKGWQLCAGEADLGPEFALEACVEQCEATHGSVCGGQFEAFVDCALQQTCDRWMGSGGGRLEGCETEFDEAMACMAGLSGPPTMEQ